MRDKPLMALIRQSLRDGLSRLGRDTVAVRQSFLPVPLPSDGGPALYLCKTADRRRGSPARTSRWDGDLGVMVNTDVVSLETTFRVTAQVTEGLGDADDLGDMAADTPSDLLKLAATVMQSTEFMTLLQAQDVGILAIADLPLQYGTDMGALPYFDATVTHRDLSIWTAPAAMTVQRKAKIV